MNTIKGIVKKNVNIGNSTETYSFLTLNPSLTDSEKLNSTDRRKVEVGNNIDISDTLKQFFSLYLTEFKGDEQEPFEGIFNRAIPKECLAVKDEEVIKNELKKIFPDYTPLIDEKKDENKNIENNDKTIIHICRNSKGKVVAGMVLEFYAKRDNGTLSNLVNFQSKSSLILTYLFVSEDQKRKGLGTYMIKNELKIITNNLHYFIEKKDTEETLFKPDFVFFEVENPLFLKENSTNTSIDNEKSDEKAERQLDKEKLNKNEQADYTQSSEEIKCLKKLAFFRKVGARWIDIPYVQPSLSKDKERVYNLFFMILPELSRGVSDNPFIINKYHVLDFLISFYNTNEDEKRIERKMDDYTFEDFYPVEIGSLPAIIEKDEDLARIFLSIEIADVIDDLEDQGHQITKMRMRDEIKSEITAKQLLFKLRDLYLKIENKDLCSKQSNIKKTENEVLNGYFKEILKYQKKIGNDYDNDTFRLKEIPSFSIQKILFNQASIAFHIALKSNVKLEHFTLIKNKKKYEEVCYEYKKKNESGQYSDKITNLHLLSYKDKDGNIMDFNRLTCSFFGSYENDLLSSNYYQEKAPIRSKKMCHFDLEIEFSEKIEFLSEGRRETLFIYNKSNSLTKNNSNKNFDKDNINKNILSYKKKVKCFLNMMFFKPDEHKTLSDEYSKIINKQNPTQKEIQKIIDYEVAIAKNIVWELVITNDIDNTNNTKIPLTEFEIIQLSKFFSGKQEKSNIKLNFSKIDSRQKDKASQSKQEDGISKDNQEEISIEIIKILNDLVDTKPSIYDVHAGTIQIDTKNIEILGKKNKNEELEEPSYYDYEPLFIEENNDNDEANESGKYKLGYCTRESRIKSLLEEYLKDNVDNIDLMNEIYFKTRATEEAISNLEIYRNARYFHFDDSFTGFEDRYNENAFMKYFFDTMCGIALGIFDYGRMGYEEVTDTISPLNESATDKAMIIMKRNTIFSLCHNNSVYESSIATIGISPYLIIPNSILVYNRIQAEQSKEFFDNVFSLTKDDISNKDFLVARENAKNSLGISNNELYQLLLVLRKRIETYLDKVNIPNVFNYGTEREIYDTGMNDRGIEESISQIKGTKNELDESIKDILEIRQSIFENLTTIFLGILSFVGLWDPIVNHLDVEREGFYIANGFLQGKYTFNLGAILLIILFIGFVLYFGIKLKNILPQHVTVDWPKFFYKKIIPIAIVILFFLLYFF